MTRYDVGNWAAVMLFTRSGSLRKTCLKLRNCASLSRKTKWRTALDASRKSCMATICSSGASTIM